MSNSDYSVQLVLAETTTPGTGSPPTFRLDLKAQKGLKSGQSLVLQVLETATTGGEATEIDRFSVRVVQQGASWVFCDVVDPRPATHPARTGKYHLTDHFQLMFAGVDGAQVCILPVPDSGLPLPALVSVKAIAKDKPLDSSCASMRVLRQFRAGMLTQKLERGARLAVGGLASGLWNKAASDAAPDQQTRERIALEHHQKTEKQAKEQYQEFLKMQDTPLKVQGLRIQEYHRNLAKIMDIRKDWEKSGGLAKSPPPPILSNLIKENQRIEEEAEQFLDISVGIPESYRVRAREGAERRIFVEKMAELENDMRFKLLCCLPLGGLAQGFVQILQGKYIEGLASIGLEVLTYGSFKALGVLRHNYDAFQAANRTMRQAVFEARYLHVLSEGAEVRLSMFKGVGEIAGSQVGFLGPLFSMGAEATQLLGQIRDIGMIMRRKKEVEQALALASNPGYQNWLRSLAQMDSKLAWFGAIRAVAFSYKTGDAVFDGAQEVGKGVERQMRQLKPKDIQKKVVEGFKSVQALLPEQEREWWNNEFVPGIERMSEEFFNPANEFISNWQQDKLEWEAEIRRLKREEWKGKRGPRMFQSKEELLADLATLMKFWEQRNAFFVKLFHSMGFGDKEIHSGLYEMYQPVVAFYDDRLDVGMASFLAQIGDAQCLLEENTMKTTRLADLVVMGKVGNQGLPKVIYVKSDFEGQATTFINLLHGESE